MLASDWEEKKHCDKFYQRPVYQLAASLINPAMQSVLDLGCGYPLKLKDFIVPLTEDITGVDLPDVIERIQSFEFGIWVAADLNVGLSLGRTFDVIICADVIEHLDNPDRLLEIIRNHSHKDTRIVISSPDIETTEKRADGMTPANIAHVKEWATLELQTFLNSHGLVAFDNRSYIEQGGQCNPYWNTCFVCSITDWM